MIRSFITIVIATFGRNKIPHIKAYQNTPPKTQITNPGILLRKSVLVQYARMYNTSIH